MGKKFSRFNSKNLDDKVYIPNSIVIWFKVIRMWETKSGDTIKVMTLKIKRSETGFPEDVRIIVNVESDVFVDGKRITCALCKTIPINVMSKVSMKQIENAILELYDKTTKMANNIVDIVDNFNKFSKVTDTKFNLVIE